MKIIITENKLQLLFNGMVSDYDKLIKSERDYDFYDESKSRYIDYTPFNFYMDDEDWENDEWIMQYAEKPPYNKPVEGFETPLLIYSEWYFKSLTTMFVDKFDDLLKEWFTLTYGYPVKMVKGYHDVNDFLGY
jgi:hypothetical protein